MFCDISPTCYKIALQKEIIKRHIKNFLRHERYADTRQSEPLPCLVADCSSHLIKRGKGIDPVLQVAEGYTVDLPTQEIVAVDLAKEGVGGKLGIYLTAVDLLDYERHDQQTRRPHRLQRRQQNRSRRRLLEVCDPSSDGKGIEHADRTLVCVRQGQHREHRVILVDGEQAVHHVDVRRQIVVCEHHALGPRHRTRRIYYDGQIIGTRHGTLPCPLRTLRYDTEILRAYDDVEHRHSLLRQLGKQFVRYEERLGLRMAYEHVELRLGEVGKDRHSDHACRRDGEVADTPVGHVAAQYRHRR